MPLGNTDSISDGLYAHYVGAATVKRQLMNPTVLVLYTLSRFRAIEMMHETILHNSMTTWTCITGILQEESIGPPHRS